MQLKVRFPAMALMMTLLVCMPVGCGDDSTPNGPVLVNPMGDTDTGQAVDVIDGGHDAEGPDARLSNDVVEILDSEPGREGPASFALDVAPILNHACVDCHNSTHVLNMSPQVAYPNLVNADAARCAGEVRVIPGDAQNSYLVKKLEGRQPRGCGSAMNFPEPRAAERLALIREWIDDGALNN